MPLLKGELGTFLQFTFFAFLLQPVHVVQIVNRSVELQVLPVVHDPRAKSVITATKALVVFSTNSRFRSVRALMSSQDL